MCQAEGNISEQQDIPTPEFLEFWLSLLVPEALSLPLALFLYPAPGLPPGTSLHLLQLNLILSDGA